MSKIKLIATDLDGTLLDENREVSAYVATEIMDICKKSGIQFTFISGRPVYAIKHIAQQMQITGPIAACNGAVIFQGDTVLKKHSLLLAPLSELMHAAVSCGCTVLYYTNGIEYAMSETEWVRVRHALGRNYPVENPFLGQTRHTTAEKVNIMGVPDEKAFQALVPFLEGLENSFEIVRYNGQGCEIIAKNVNKATGLAALAALAGVALCETMAVGDNENDVAMLKACGCGVAVNNATPAAKQSADIVCENSFTQGVLEAVRYAAERE